MNTRRLAWTGAFLLIAVLSAAGGYLVGQNKPVAESASTLWNTTSAAVTRRTIVVVGLVTEVDENLVWVKPLNGDTDAIGLPFGSTTVTQLIEYVDGQVQTPREISLQDIRAGDRIDATVNLLEAGKYETPSLSVWRGDQT